MATQDIIVLGSAFVESPSVSNVSDAGGGSGIEIISGSTPFESDDIIVVTFTNFDGSDIDGDNPVSQITVYDNVQDYLDGTVKYLYGPENPGQTASIQSGADGLGDTFVRFNSNVLKAYQLDANGDVILDQNGNPATDTSAPSLNNSMLTPGVDATNLPISIVSEQGVDYDGDGIIDSVIDTNFNTGGSYYAQEVIDAAVCLTRGTLINTPSGPRLIETLQEGDLVDTLDSGPQPIRWIGSREVAATGVLAPVVIKAGALGNTRELKVSPNHRMMVRGPEAEILFGERDVLIAAKHLVDDEKIRVVEGGTVDYFHVLFDEHQIIFAESCPTESLYPGEQALESLTPDAREEVLTLFPELHGGLHNAQLARLELTAWEAAALRASS